MNTMHHVNERVCRENTIPQTTVFFNKRNHIAVTNYGEIQSLRIETLLEITLVSLVSRPELPSN